MDAVRRAECTRCLIHYHLWQPKRAVQARPLPSASSPPLPAPFSACLMEGGASVWKAHVELKAVGGLTGFSPPSWMEAPHILLRLGGQGGAAPPAACEILVGPAIKPTFPPRSTTEVPSSAFHVRHAPVNSSCCTWDPGGRVGKSSVWSQSPGF